MLDVYRRLFEPSARVLLFSVPLMLGLAFGSSLLRNSNSAVPVNTVCDHGNTTPIPTHGRAIDRAYRVSVILGKHRFSVPYGYLGWPPSVEQLKCGSLRGAASFQYWIPDLDAPEKPIMYSAYDRPVEKNRPARGPDESVINVFRIQPYGPGYKPSRSRAASEIDLYHLATNGKGMVKDLGLWKTAPSPGELAVVHWFGEGESERLVITCLGKLGRCEASLDLKDQLLDVRLIFARDAVAQHGAIVNGIRTLLDRWRLQP